MAKRKSIGTRARFEILKRDDFTCRYCGKKSPEVILEVDHIVPVVEGGSDDPINLGSSCHGCNAGKGGRPLEIVSTGEDAYLKAVELYEKERELREYERLRGAIEERRAQDLEKVLDFVTYDVSDEMRPYILRALKDYSFYDVRDAVQVAHERMNGWQPKTTRYFCGIVRNWREHGGPPKEPAKSGPCWGCNYYAAAEAKSPPHFCSEDCLNTYVEAEVEFRQERKRGQ